LNKKLEKKEDVTNRLQMLEEFNTVHETFDKKCREVSVKARYFPAISVDYIFISLLLKPASFKN